MAALAGLMLLLATPAWAAQRVALVIGNGAYAHQASLPNPPNDAADVSAALERLGFTVTSLNDAGKSDLERALQELMRDAAGSDLAVVFYAGHGIEVDQQNFLVPVDAKLLSDQDVEFEAVSLHLALRAVRPASGLGLVILDACRNNPFVAAMRSSDVSRNIGRGLARVEPNAAQTLVAYAAREGTIADDGADRNSPYTTALLRYLEEPGLEITRMFRLVRDAVLTATDNRQQPFTSGSLSSEDIFLAADAGQARWEAVRQSTDPAVLRSFIAEFPDSRFAAPARKKLSELAQAHWKAIEDSNKPAELRAFLDVFPDGPLAQAARARLNDVLRLSQVQRCDGHLHAERLSSAARCYRGILREQPDHLLAQEGLAAIADIYSHAAEEALREAQAQARSYRDALRQVEGQVARLGETDAGHAAIAGLREELQRLRVDDGGEMEGLRSEHRRLQAAADAWVRVQESGAAPDYEAFLEEHGESPFAQPARRRLAQMEEDARRWEAVKDSTQATDFETFLLAVLQGSPGAQALERWQALLQEEAPSGETQEALAWEEVRNTTRASDVEGFLSDFPNGRFAAEARGRLAELRKAGAEAREWNRIKNFRTAQAFETFLRDHPDGRFVAAARSRLNELRKAAAESREWNRIKNFTTAQTFETFLRDHPDGQFAAAARSRLQELRKGGAEAREWNRIKNSRTAQAFETFLRDYPQGRFAAAARSRLNELRKAEAESREWNRIKNFRTAQAFETFLRDYPQGRFAAAARNRLNELRKAEAESREWNRIKNFRTAQTFETFLRNYPDGRFAAAARSRLQELRRPSSAQSAENALRLSHADRRLIQLGLSAAGFQPGAADGVFGPRTRAAITSWQLARGQAATGYLDNRSAETLRTSGKSANQRTKAETDAWNRIKSSRSAANFEAFLRNYPNGRFAAEARRRLNGLRNPASREAGLRHGTKTFSDARYVGQLRGDKRHGRGTLTWNSGARYVGDWRDGKRKGRGTMTYDNGNRYEGEWRDNERHGHGTLTWNSGARYEGEWRDNKRHGRGTITYDSGNRYEGDWKDNKRHGRGTMTWKRGTRYEGEWRDDKAHGLGTYTAVDGRVYAGRWRQGCYGRRAGRWATVATTAEACGFE
ncbi:MAG: caspase family protein [Candidatus Tectomicrobia bacterium]|nr:caspase family protein [Candidatus Tectomicrobia bacterium]